jgi:hypothetical protein
LALAVPLSRFTSRVGGGSAFFVRRIMRVLLICALVVVGIPALIYLLWFVHRALDRVCVRHARRFCRRHGLEIRRVRWQMEFERRSDGRRGVKTEFTLVQLDCFDSQKQHRLVLLRVWPLGVRKLVSDEIYPESYDSQWPQNTPNTALEPTPTAP